MITATQPKPASSQPTDAAFEHISNHVGTVCTINETHTSDRKDEDGWTSPRTQYRIFAPDTINVPLAGLGAAPATIGGDALIADAVEGSHHVYFDFEASLLKIEGEYAIYLLTVDAERWFSAY